VATGRKSMTSWKYNAQNFTDEIYLNHTFKYYNFSTILVVWQLGYEMGDWGIGVWFLIEARIFSSP
jgi:hypothetical protein